MRTGTDVGAGDRLPPSGLAERLRALAGLGIDGLRAEWRRVHRASPPRGFSRDLLLRDLAYQLQEAALGGLPVPARRRLASVAGGRSVAEARKPPATPQLRPGTALVREWHGRAHSVVVQGEGFEYQGRRYASLSEIARQITGSHWSGPRFFGLKRRTRVAETGAEAGRGEHA